METSAAVSALLRDGSARGILAREQLHAPHLIDAEIAQTLRRLVATQHLTATDGGALVSGWGELAVVRHPVHPLLPRIWQLRDNLSAYEATYAALAETLGCALLTADARLARASGPTCPITIVPG